MNVCYGVLRSLVRSTNRIAAYTNAKQTPSLIAILAVNNNILWNENVLTPPKFLE